MVAKAQDPGARPGPDPGFAGVTISYDFVDFGGGMKGGICGRRSGGSVHDHVDGPGDDLKLGRQGARLFAVDIQEDPLV